VAFDGSQPCSASDILAAADRAMYRAKSAGGDAIASDGDHTQTSLS
jgi:GGDEF domain-containing protein